MYEQKEEITEIFRAISVIRKEDWLIKSYNEMGLSKSKIRTDDFENKLEKLFNVSKEFLILEDRYSMERLHYSSLAASRKRDPYIAGGIASALGGTGLGVATALDVQKENEKIDGEYSKRYELYNKINEYEKRVKAKERELIMTWDRVRLVLGKYPELLEQFKEILAKEKEEEERKKQIEEEIKRKKDKESTIITILILFIVALLTIASCI